MARVKPATAARAPRSQSLALSHHYLLYFSVGIGTQYETKARYLLTRICKIRYLPAVETDPVRPA